MNGTENAYIYMPRCDGNLGNLLDGSTMGDKKRAPVVFFGSSQISL